MGDPRGFLKVEREEALCRPVCERIRDYRDVMVPKSYKESEEQASRCMDCGTPFCHWGCPLGNYIPEWNDMAFRGRWRKAFDLLEATTDIPEIVGRICPALCEYACVLGINDDPATIRENELAIIEYAFKKGWVRPKPPKRQTGKRAAVIGSGPAGLSCAAQLNRRGHKVVVFEKDDKVGGILRYGIPDFKLEKWIIDRRLKIWKKEGVEFRPGVNVGVDYPISKLKREFDAICLAGGCRMPRDLNIEGRGLKGIHFAMDYLTQSNKRIAGEKIPSAKRIDAKGKKVVIIGGGDTGADCVGTANRQGANRVVQIEILERPPECRGEDCPWPIYPLLLKSTSSHEEGVTRHWLVSTKRFIGEKGHVEKLSCAKTDTSEKFEIEADLVILAVGFVHPEHNGLLDKLGVKYDRQNNVKTNENYVTCRKGVFSAGDMRRGQSLAVWAAHEGRETARNMDVFFRKSADADFH